jgi:transcription elongation factor GreA
MEEAKKVPLTQSAFDRLKEELAHLEGEAREKIIKEIATARAHGDLSENAEYHTAKDQQGLQEGRAKQIRHMLENAEIIHTQDDGVVNPGMLVTLQYEGDEPETYLLGLREERDGEHDILTPDSPLGEQLIGRRQGEEVVFQSPGRHRDEGKKIKVSILEVRTPN